MYIMTLDVKSTHVSNPNCPMRIARLPSGGWMCVDCGLSVIHKCINTDQERVLPRLSVQFNLDDPMNCLLDFVDDDLVDPDHEDTQRCSRTRRRTGTHFPPPSTSPPPVPPDADEGTKLVEADTWLDSMGVGRPHNPDEEEK